MLGLSDLDYGVMIIYLLAVVGIGAYCSRGEDNAESYLLGGRKMPWLAVGISCLMSLLSTYSLVMVPGEIFNHGLSLWVFTLLNPVIAVFAFSLFVRFYFKLKSFTPFEYLEKRYDSRVRTLIATIYLYARLLYLATVLFATSKVFEGGAGWPAWQTITLVGVIGILYTVMGGMKAVVWTDVMQFAVLVVGIGAAMVMLCWKIDGGPVEAVRYAFANGRGVDRFSESDFYSINPYVRLSFWLIIIGNVTNSLSMGASDQINIQRLLSTSSYKNAFRAQLTASLLTLPMTLILWLIGLAVFTFYSLHPDPNVTSGDTAFFTFIARELPSPVPGLILAAMLAAVMSTLDSGINSLATVWLKEIHQKYIKKETTDSEQVRISRYATLITGIIVVGIGLLIACSSEWLGQTVVEAATIFYAFDAIMFPAFLYAILSRRTSSVLIWITASILWGLKFGMLSWYMLSNRAAKVWQEGDSLSYAGTVSSLWIVVPLAIFAVLFAAWLIRRKAGSGPCLAGLGIALFPLGYALGTTIWYLSSRYYGWEKPMALSFQWVSFPVIIAYLLIGLVGLKLGRIQSEEKWKGLTIFSSSSEK